MADSFPAPSSSNACRWGIIGGGDVCEKKGGPPLYRLERSELVAVTRRNREAGADFCRRHGPSTYLASVDALLADPRINCIYVASPPEVHLEHVLASAQAGKHILCEKPMAVTSNECTSMVEACVHAGVTLGVAYYRRGYPSVQRAKELLQAGDLGEVTSIWLNTQFPISHRLDLVQYFCGNVTSVQLATSDQGEPELLATTEAGAQVTTCLGFEEAARTEQIRLGLANGELFIHDLKGGAFTITRGNQTKEETFEPLPYTHWGLVENFIDHLHSNVPLLCDGVTGRATSVVLDGVSNLKSPGQTEEIDLQNPHDYQPEQGSKFRLLA